MEKEFWDQRWKDQQTGWDIGYPSRPLQEYIDQMEDKDIRILIPGAGNSYEAEYLHKKGFTNVFVIDISPLAIESFKKRYPDFPENHLICGNFFDLNETFDLILEQTFFCALNPDMRDDYCQKMSKVLAKDGKLVGLMFNFPLDQGPPFGGSKEEYVDRLSNYFSKVEITDCYNSIEPRAGREYWICIQH